MGGKFWTEKEDEICCKIVVDVYVNWQEISSC